MKTLIPQTNLNVALTKECKNDIVEIQNKEIEVNKMPFMGKNN